jgi:ATP synthase protein I
LSYQNLIVECFLVKPKDGKKIRRQQFLAFTTIPFALAVPPLIGWAIGSWLDTFFKTTPYLMFFLLILGFVAGCRECYRIVKRYGNGF